MALEGVTFDLQTVGSRDDGSINWAALGGRDCLLEPNMTFNLTSGTSITLSTGHIALGGRVIRVNGAYVFSLTPTVTTGYGRIIARIDLSQPVTEQTFDQISIVEEYVTSEANFAQLTQGFINMPNFSGEYEQELCRFTVADGEASEITKTLRGIKTISSEEISISYGGKTGTATVYRYGDIATLRVSLGSGTGYFTNITGTDTIGTLPDEYKPLAQVSSFAMLRANGAWATSANDVGLITLSTSGSIVVNTQQSVAQASRYLLASITWLCAPYEWGE